MQDDELNFLSFSDFCPTNQQPQGGVKEGQQFHAIVLNNDVDALAASANHNIPTGRWRDDICDCLKLGICHAQCCLAFFFPPVALGQVLSRMKLDWSGDALNGRNPVMSAFKVMLLSFVLYNVIDSVMSYVTYPYSPEYNPETGTFTTPDNVPSWVATVDAARQGLSLLYSLFVLFIMIRARGYIRSKYQIPEQSCQGCEDCCCSFWCSPCTVCQMARHTADYSTYNASCCSETGLDPRAPQVV